MCHSEDRSMLWTNISSRKWAPPWGVFFCELRGGGPCKHFLQRKSHYGPFDVAAAVPELPSFFVA